MSSRLPPSQKSHNTNPIPWAKNGINDATELAYTTAEHHPYWNLLYNSSEIANTVLEKWQGKLSVEEIDEIKWAIKELTQTLEKIKS